MDTKAAYELAAKAGKVGAFRTVVAVLRRDQCNMTPTRALALAVALEEEADALDKEINAALIPWKEG